MERTELTSSSIKTPDIRVRMGKVSESADFNNVTSSLQLDEEHPGIDEVTGAYEDVSERERIIRKYGEYHYMNIRFWVFMILAVIISTFSAIAVYTGTGTVNNRDGRGTKESVYQKLDKPPLSPSLELVIIGFIIFYGLLGYLTYHVYKERNCYNYRQSGLFFMIMIYALSLWWLVIFYSQSTPSDASIILIITIVGLLGYMAMIYAFSEHEQDKIWVLLLGVIWLLYLLYFNIGVINKNPTYVPPPIEKCSCLGDPDERVNRFNNFERHSII